VDPKPPPSPAPPPPPAAVGPALNNLPTICPVCGDGREEDAQFCQNCGHNFVTGATPAASTGRLTGPVLVLVVLFWAILGIAGLYWLYTGLYRL
jgi:hypothetical protein